MPLASLKFLQPRYVLDWLLNFAIILHFIALITPRTAPIVPRGQDRPRISLERSRYLSENCSRNVIADSDSTGPEETSRLTHALIIPIARLQFCPAERNLSVHRAADQLQ